MHFLILGASGRTGQHTTAVALSHSHSVTALVRNPSTFPVPSHPSLTVHQGSPLSLPSISSAISSAPASNPITAVIITLAVPRSSDSPFAKPTAAPYLIRDSVRNALDAMETHGVKRLVVMSAFGTGDSWGNLAWPFRMIFTYAPIRCVLEDHNAVEKTVRETAEGKGVGEWTMVRPPLLKEGGVKEVREYGEVGEGMGMMAGVTRESVAEFLVRVAEKGGYSGKAVVIAN